MALIYVTGAPGAGKTTLQKELELRGYETRDMDDPDLGGPHNKATNRVVQIPAAAERSPQWFEEHEWRTYPTAIKKLQEEARQKDIFVCGVAPDDEQVLSYFDTIIYLELPNAVLEHRLANRTGNDYGKNSFEVADILQRKARLDKRYAKLDVTKVNAEGTIAGVVGRILDGRSK